MRTVTLVSLLGLAMCCPLSFAQTPQNIGTNTEMWFTKANDGEPQLHFSITPADGNEEAFLAFLETYPNSANAVVTYHTYTDPTERFACGVVLANNGTGSCEFYDATGTQAYIFTGYFTGIDLGLPVYFYQPSESLPVLAIPAP